MQRRSSCTLKSGHQQCFKGHRVTVSACHEVYYYNLLESQMGETSLKIYKGAVVSIICKSVLAYLLSLKRMEEHIMNENRRKEGKV